MEIYSSTVFNCVYLHINTYINKNMFCHGADLGLIHHHYSALRWRLNVSNARVQAQHWPEKPRCQAGQPVGLMLLCTRQPWW